jgi:hypothetical protein
MKKTLKRIKNVNGTSKRSCSCGSWLNHWRNFSEKRVYVCKAEGCSNTDIVGAHVTSCNSLTRTEWIVPLCRAHNQVNSNTCFDLKDETILVSANKSITDC